MKKRILAIILLSVMLSVSVSSCATKFDVVAINIAEAKIVGCNYDGEIIEVPGYIGTKKIVEIEKITSGNQKVILPDTIKTISPHVFSTVKSVFSKGTVEKWASIDLKGVLFTFDSTKLFFLDSDGDIECNGKKYSELTDVVISGSIETIKQYTFSQVKGLKSVKIGPSVQTVGQEAFSQVQETFTELELGENVKTIESYAFWECRALNKVTLNDRLERIEVGAFYFIAAENIVVPTSLSYIGPRGIVSSVSGAKLFYKGSEEQWGAIEKGEDATKGFTTYFYSETEPSDSGNYWHYDANSNPAIWE